MSRLIFKNILTEKDGLIKGPFGGDIKKSLFVPKSDSSYKVYEQGVVLNRNVHYGHYYITKEYFDKKLKRFEVKENDILLTGAGTLGEMFKVPKNAPKGIINQALLRIRLNYQVVDQNFFKYYFKYYIKSIISNINGDSVIPNLPPLSIIKATEIDIPNIKVQNKIASVLSTLDDKIELNNKINYKLDCILKNLYDYWFVQFDFPDEYGKPYKSGGGGMVWSEELKRFIPKGWEIKKIGDLLEKHTDTSKKIPSKEILDVGNYPVISQDAKSFISGYTDEESPITKIPLIIFGDHSCTLRYVDFPFFRGADGTQILTFESNQIFYVYLFLESSIINLPQYGKYERHYKYLKELVLLIPPKELLIKFNVIIKPSLEKKKNILLENKKLAELRDWLLPMLMNGQVKVI